MDAGHGVVYAATALTLLFVIQYTLSSPWWRDQVGRTVVMKDVCLLALLVPSSVLMVWPHALTPLQAEWIGVSSIGGVAIAMAWRMAVWYRIRKPWPLRRRSR
jgi:hypothetical protein